MRMLEWIEMVWKPFALSKGGQKTILLLDQYTVHKTREVIDKLKRFGTIVILLPAGETSKVQVLDVGINKPFKDYLKTTYLEKVSESADDGLELKVGRKEAGVWIKKAWRAISEKTVVATYRRIFTWMN
jgi:hypothetical protein